jgi:exonuclease SbcD
MIPGNHDSAERVRFGSRQMQQAGLHIVGNLTDSTQPVVLRGAHGEVHFYCIPYNDPEHVRSEFANELEETGEEIRTHDQAHSWLVNRIHAVRNRDVPCVLVSHCFVDGATESESERPLSVGGADRVSWQPLQDFAYVALGHLHAPQHQGAGHIRYSGSLLKYSFSEEKQPKGVTLVEIAADGTATHWHLPLQPLRDVRVIEGLLGDVLQQGRQDVRNEDYVMVRLKGKEAILDVMAKLRAVYPNVLHVERPDMLGVNTSPKSLTREQLRRSELDIFADFFREMSGGQEMSDDQKQVIDDIVKNLHTGEVA